MQRLLQSRFPKGFAFDIAPGSQSDDLIISDEENIYGEILSRADDCGTVRNPYRCADLTALSDEYGIPPYQSGDIEAYRSYLATNIYGIYRTGSAGDLQTALRSAGFTTATVVKNNKCQDPREFTGGTPIMVANQDHAVAGNDLAYAGYSGYEILANGPLRTDTGKDVGYIVGADPDYWCYIDFVCESATFDVDGNITSLVPIQIDSVQEEAFKRLILKIKPLHSWVILAVEYVESEAIVQTGDALLDLIIQTGDPVDDVIIQEGN